MIKLKQSGLNEINRLFEQLGANLADNTLARAIEKCPVDTGNLRDSIAKSGDGRNFAVGTDVDYALAVELGTAHTNPQPFLEPALIESVENIEESKP